MINSQDEAQAKEFLKRIEIITMKKDLRKLREADAIKEKNKIISGGFQKITSNKPNSEELKEVKEKFEREKILNENYVQEIEAEKQLKNYANEEEKQRIFILESQKIELDKKIKDERLRLEPALVMKKNDLNLEKKKVELKLRDLKIQEEKLEAEEKIISEREKVTNIPLEKKSLEKTRQELETKVQEIEKRRWEIEREISKEDSSIEVVDQDYKKIIDEENNLKQRITDIDKQLRQIYSQIVQRIQKLKEKEKEDIKTAQTETAKIETKEKEEIQRQQWARTPSAKYPEKEYLKTIPSIAKANLEKQAEAEEEHRRKFLENIEAKAKQEENKK
jgi:hypothetical protein